MAHSELLYQPGAEAACPQSSAREHRAGQLFWLVFGVCLVFSSQVEVRYKLNTVLAQYWQPIMSSATIVSIVTAIVAVSHRLVT